MPEKVAIRKGIFKEDDEGGVLIGSKCRSCGQILFPPDSFCIKCFKEDMAPVNLSREGTLYSYSISYAPTANFSSTLCGRMDIITRGAYNFFSFKKLAYERA